ncbi:MAG: DNA translocase FtsK 4TM domain-containing protein [Ignavibacteriaceae bacterium]|nr:DNA translocase FtsK 4TM domain-containing protein [Ignavibacteriaceae bacterium]
MVKRISRQSAGKIKKPRTKTPLGSSNKKAEEDFKIGMEAKIQILGFLIFVLGVMVLISVFFYSEADQVPLSRLNFTELLKKETYSGNNKFQNPLGIFGAITSNFLITYFFGYFSSILILQIIISGALMLFEIPMKKMFHIVIFSLLLMLMLGTIAGLSRIFFGATNIPVTYSGTTGDFTATILYQTLGPVGSSFVSVTGLILSLMFLFDRNIPKTFHKIISSFVFIAVKVKDIVNGIVGKLKQSGKSKAPVNKSAKTINRTDTEDVNESVELIVESPQDDDNLIKQTRINRPEDEVIIASSQTLSKKPLSETEINPDNSNELLTFDSSDEDDLEEEILENYIKPGLDLLKAPTKEEYETIPDEELTDNGKLLQEKLLKFGIEIESVTATPGPVVTLYELVPAPEVKLSKIESLQDDIALAMKARGIRMIIPIPGKGTVGVEIPNSKAQTVRIKSILSSRKFNDSTMILPIAFGKMIDGQVYVDDLAKMPHILIAGATGAGKSVGINSIITSLLYRMHPSDLKFVMIDPKKIELSLYTKLKKHFLATSSDINESIMTSSPNAVSILKSVEKEMEERYNKLANAGVRNIEAYNKKIKSGELRNKDTRLVHRNMPYIVVIIDELADLMITAKREIEEPIARIAQMARAVGIHLIVATQRPSVDVITGVIKANFPVRVAYQVASRVDSRTIIDISGAEQLLRNGDMLFLSSSAPRPIRIQNAFISTEECEKIAEFIGSQKGFTRPFALPSVAQKLRGGNGGETKLDELFETAARLVLQLQACSVSTIQRRLRVGFSRAGSIVDQLEDAGIVGPGQGSKPREILVTEDELEEILNP